MSECEELFDVVDTDDQVIDCQPRSVVHARNLLHRSVHVLACDADDRVFLQLRGLDRDCDPNLWDSSVGGHLQSGEDYDQAVMRETQEELGVNLATVPQRLFKLSAGPATGYEFCWVYRLSHAGPFTIDPNEAATGRWFSTVELNERLAAQPTSFTSSFRMIWARYSAL